jgi:hypothetical protein
MVLLGNVDLIDADGINPENSRLVRGSQSFHCGFEVERYLEDVPTYCDGCDLCRITQTYDKASYVGFERRSTVSSVTNTLTRGLARVLI